MGPRLFSRGNWMATPRVYPERIRLQWGRGFSAAETLQAWASRQPPASASMGPRLFSRGNVGLPDVFLPGKRGFNGAAAFQPRKQLGKENVPMCPMRFNGAAAFQPRKQFIGSPYRSGVPGFNGAAAFQPRKRSRSSSWETPTAKLQWGRGFSAAETPHGRRGARGDQ